VITNNVVMIAILDLFVANASLYDKTSITLLNSQAQLVRVVDVNVKVGVGTHTWVSALGGMGRW